MVPGLARAGNVAAVIADRKQSGTPGGGRPLWTGPQFTNRMVDIKVVVG
jgi:hypothetical protein